MSPTFTDDEIGKSVETAAGEPLGVVADVDEATAYVDPEPGTDDADAGRGGADPSDDAVPLADDTVDEITDDAVLLDDEFPEESITTGASSAAEADRPEGAGGESGGRAPGEPISSTATEAADDVGEAESGLDADDRGETDPGTRDLDESGPGMDDHDADAEGDALLDASEEIDGDRERRGAPRAGTVDEDGGAEPDADDGGTRSDVDVDPDDVTDGDPEADVRPDEDVG